MRITAIFVAVTSVIASLATAQVTTTWTGASGTAWSDSGNWDTDVPGDEDTAVFSGTPVNQPDIGTGDSLKILQVESGGWVFSSDDGSGGYGNLGFRPDSNRDATNEVNIIGGGLTLFNANLTAPEGYNAPDLFAASGSKVVVNGNVVNPTGRSWGLRGAGYFVFNGTVPFNSDFYPQDDGAGNYGTYIYNTPGAVYVARSGTAIQSGQVLGGTTPEAVIFQYASLAVQAGGAISPGGDGATVGVEGYDGGDLISTMLFRSSNSTIRAEVSMNSGAELIMDLGTSAGVNDQIALGSLSNDFDLNGCSLTLRGPATPAAGVYTLMTESVSGSDVNGTFGTLTYNGTPFTAEDDGDIFTLSYAQNGTIDNVVLTVIPEPATLGLWGLAALALYLRRRKA